MGPTSSSGVMRLSHTPVRSSPYTIPQELRFTPSRHDNVPVSTPPSPSPGLTEKQIKTLHKQHKRTDEEVELISAVLQHLTGELLDKSTLVESLAHVLEHTTEARSFSAMTNEDYSILNRGERAPIHVNYEKIGQHSKEDMIPNEWFDYLSGYRGSFCSTIRDGSPTNHWTFPLRCVEDCEAGVQ